MDKLKIFLAAAKKYQFWVFCGVMLLTSLGCWWWASGALAKSYGKRATEIDGDFTGAVVQSGAPNEGVIAKVKQQDDELKLKVYSAWETLYNEQKKNNPFPTKVLGEDFKNKFESLQLPKDQLDDYYLERYQNFIKTYLPTLETMIKVRHEVGGPEGAPASGAPSNVRPPRSGGGTGIRGAGAGMRPGMNMGGPRGGLGGLGADSDKEYTGIVDWDDCEHVKGRFDWGDRTPTTLEVVLAQEDLWVYEALLRVIQKVNAAATSQANAPVKRIEALEIGKDSVNAWDQTRRSVFSAAKASSLMPGAMGQGGERPRAGGELGGRSTNSGEQSLVESRYLDEKGQPLPASESEYPYAKHPFREYKMMPIRMSLWMDQRRVPMLLVECANSNMPIDVRRFRILKTPVPPLEPANSTTGSAGPARPSGREMGGMGMMGMGGPPTSGGMRGGPADAGGAGRSGANATEDTTGQVDVPVEIYAVIYIFNPPDRAKLGIPEVKNPAGATAPADPASAPPTTAPTTQPSPATTPGK